MALGVGGEAPPDRTHPVLGTLRGVPEGSFTSQVQVYPSEDRTQRRVTVARPFHMMRSEVTRGMWAAVMGERPPAYGACGADCPVTDVSPAEVEAFIAALSVRDGVHGYAGATPYEKRGGSWFAGAHQATVFAHHPVAAGEANDGLGFRLVVDAPGR
jgi:hypothetical protein